MRYKQGKHGTLAHRNLMSEVLGRELGANEVVHHKDLNKQNNDPKNLVVMDRSTHTALHNYLRHNNIEYVRVVECGRFSSFI